MALTARVLLLWLACCAMAWAQPDDGPPPAGVQLLEQAQALLQPEGSAAVSGTVTLTHRWDKAYPRQGGAAEYRLLLPAQDAPQNMALLFTRIGNQAQVEVNGSRVLTLGKLGDPAYDGAKGPQMAAVPVSLLRAGQANELVVRVTTQRQRWGGLAAVRYGPEAAVQKEYRSLRQWRYIAHVVFCVALGIMGLMVLGLWARLRDPLFACFSAAAFLGIFRNLDRVWPDVPVPWPAWGMVVATAYAWHLALMCVFSLLALQERRVWLSRLLWAYLPVSLGLVALSFAGAWPQLYSAALVLLAPLGVMTLAVVVRSALRQGPRRPASWALVIAGALAVLAGLHDVGLVRLGLGGLSRSSLTPHVMFLFVAIMAGIIVDRYARSAAGLKVLNQTLETRVHEREDELRAAFQELQARQAAQATLDERQRIMRDLHDGVGAQLVGLLNMVGKPGAGPEVLREQVKAALDEMRLAVDSMQIGDGDLTTALATLRYRVQPRLEAASLAMHWSVDEMPPLPGVTPHAVLQLQRIVLEALTNILKHAGARTVWLTCTWAPGEGRLVLEVADDGQGLAPPAEGARGAGLANMGARAESIGARLEMGPREGGGTLVRLDWPLGGARTAVAG